MLCYVQRNTRGRPKIPALCRGKRMYKAEKTEQMTFEDFNQSCGMKLDMNDEWIVVAGRVDWNAVEERYMEFFPSKRGRPALGARPSRRGSAPLSPTAGTSSAGCTGTGRTRRRSRRAGGSSPASHASQATGGAGASRSSRPGKASPAAPSARSQASLRGSRLRRS